MAATTAATAPLVTRRSLASPVREGGKHVRVVGGDQITHKVQQTPRMPGVTVARRTYCAAQISTKPEARRTASALRQCGQPSP